MADTMKVIPLLLMLFVLFATSASARVACEQTDDHIVVMRNGRHVLTYHKTIRLPDGVAPWYGRSGFIHPISTPSGRILTDGYPQPHHSHQNGLFFAWRKATFEGEPMNFWEAGQQRVMHNKVLEIFNEDQSAGFKVRLAHVSGPRTILDEIWTVRVHADTGYIDLTSEQRCATDAPIRIERFHYGGMAIRGSRQWFKDAHTSAGKGALADEYVASCQMLTSEGFTQADGNNSRPSWVCISGPVDGVPVFITLIPHPSNFRHPQYVRLHPEMPYFCFTPAVKEPFLIEPDKPYVSRYRIIAGDGEPDAGRFSAVQQAFALEK